MSWEYVDSTLSFYSCCCITVFVVKIISCCKNLEIGIRILGEMSANVYSFGIERREKLFIYVALTKSLPSKKIMVCPS